eukprot:CAMPEP_0181471518 /NCGR_PEP_ID=MMETSP1110-20121109/39117_1 /TAXON_ID=174948 /ORGANISM="Symbiodinium sp., Strain CCMP421" /LENGTH=152 /DNA_ID=CAMNT_0023596541 /DNA_START=37 /DNA_END=495 /DNA_ORIENTATION=+
MSLRRSPCQAQNETALPTISAKQQRYQVKPKELDTSSPAAVACVTAAVREPAAVKPCEEVRDASAESFKSEAAVLLNDVRLSVEDARLSRRHTKPKPPSSRLRVRPYKREAENSTSISPKTASIGMAQALAVPVNVATSSELMARKATIRPL